MKNNQLTTKNSNSNNRNVVSSNFAKNISHNTLNWLNRLKRKEQEQDSESKSKKIILYQLKISENKSSKSFVIIPLSALILKNGGYGKFAQYKYKPNKLPEYFQTIDYGLIENLDKISGKSSYGDAISCTLDGKVGAKLLLEILKTGRCIIEDENNPGKIKSILNMGEKRKANINWQISEDATQNIVCSTIEGSNYTIPTIPAFYIDLVGNCCGIVESKIPDEKLSLLLQSPAVLPDEAKIVSDHLKNITDDIALPQKLPQAKDLKASPIPHLHLSMGRLRIENNFYVIPITELSYQYFDKILPYEKTFNKNHQEQYQEQYLYKNKELFKVIYDFKKQRQIVNTLNEHNIFYQEVYSVYYSSKPLNVFLMKYSKLPNGKIDEQACLKSWEDFIHTKAQNLRDAGFIITSSEDFPISLVNIIYPDSEWSASVKEFDDKNSDKDWFDFEIGIYANGKKISLLPILINLLKTSQNQQPNQQQDIFDDLEKMKPGENINVKISKHEAIALPADRVAKLLSFLKDLHDFVDYSDKGLKLSKASALSLLELQNEGNLKWQASAKWQELVEKQKNGPSLIIDEVIEPKGLTIALRHYQHEGLRWLKFLQENNFGGILADDMGLGKTIQTLAHIMLAKEQGQLSKPVLIIAPTSVVFNWVKEIEKFTPSLKSLLLYGNDRIKLFDNIEEYDIILSTYALIIRDQEKLAKTKFYAIVLDEAQYIKNSQAKVTQSICGLNAIHRLCLTGTPMENHLGELWSLFHFLMPGFLGSSKKFQEFYRAPIEKNHNIERQQGLVKKIRPFILRRSKDDVLAELPAKTTIIKYVEFEQDQRDLYETIRISVQHELMKNIAEQGLHKSQIAILDGLLKLRQVCCDPRLIKTKSAAKITSSAKLDALKIMLKEMVAENRHILIFSQFVGMIEIIENECQEMSIKSIKLTGESKNRDLLVKQFQEGNIPVFLISLRAGGTGLNLTKADTVIQYDPWWNPAVEQQALSRAHRMGQEKPVFIYKMIGKGSVEEKILSMQGKKQALADRLLSNQDTIDTKLQIEDVNELFAAMI
jgi:SNF2 family DNA or RNA helicase